MRRLNWRMSSTTCFSWPTATLKSRLGMSWTGLSYSGRTEREVASAGAAGQQLLGGKESSFGLWHPKASGHAVINEL